MAVARVQVDGAFDDGAPGSSLGAGFAASTAGNMFLCFMSWDYSNSATLDPTIADTLTSSWTKFGTTLTDNTSTQRAAAWWAPVGGTGAVTITVTLSGPEFNRRMIIAEYSGTNSAISQFATTQKGSGATGANGFVDNSLTPSVDNSMLTSWMDCTQAQSSIAAGTGWTERFELGNIQQQFQDASQTTAASLTAQWTCGTATRFNSFIVVLPPLPPLPIPVAWIKA